VQDIIRKRVTRVGSGAFSIYLPKKWLDAWTPTQQASREVDLHHVGDGILVTPVLADRSLEHAIEPDPKAVRRWLLSAYLRGMNDVTLRPAHGAFGTDAIIAGRDFLRHLDERLVATCGSDAIRYSLNAQLPPPAATASDILNAMHGKVLEMLGLAEDAVRTYAIEPDRSLHALRLLQALHEEDVSRYFHQALRMVATVELPLTTVTDFQLLDLVAADLHRVSDHCLRIGTTVLRAYGLELQDLAFPRDHLISRVAGVPAPSGVALQILRTYPKGFEDAHDLLERLSAAMGAPNMPALAELIGDAYRAQDLLQQRIFAAVVENWGTGDTSDPATLTSAFTAYQLSVPLMDIMGAVAVTARHGLGLLTAAPAT
jgi:phosphate uptake regulator